VKALRSSLVLLSLCSLFGSSLVLADDCSDSLMAESCACRSDVLIARGHLKSSKKDASPAADSKASKRAKSTLASAATASRD